MFKHFQLKYPEYFFVAKFLFLFFCLYYGIEFFIGITSPGNYYNAFLSEHFNFIKWYRFSILKCAEILSNLIGYKATMLTSVKLEGYNGYRVNMIYSCIGYGIISFWIAFTLSYTSCKKHKLIWLICGLCLLWLANVVRVLLLLLAINKTKNPNTFSHHHLVYNIATYIIVFCMIYFFVKDKKVKDERN